MGWHLPKDLEAEILARADKVGPSTLPPTEPVKKSAESQKASRKVAGTTIPPVAWKAFKIPQPTPEYRFCERKWRIDYAWVDAKIGLEIDGGVWRQGRHTRGAGFIKDQEKRNRLVVLGWRIIHCVPDDIKTGAVFTLLKELFQ